LPDYQSFFDILVSDFALWGVPIPVAAAITDQSIPM
jgi:hypothetical protein